MKKKVVLVHGFFKNSKDMEFLNKNLSYKGYECLSINLPLTFKSLEENFLIFEEKIKILISKLNENEKIVLVGHSTGGLIIRNFLTKTEFHSYINCSILIATPNKGSSLADFMCKIPGIKNIFKTLRDIRTKNIKKLSLYSKAKSNMAIISGDKSDLLIGKILFSEPNDGRVSVFSSEISCIKESIILPFDHLKIHHKMETVDIIDHYIKTHTFKK